jgi:alpha-mannosidase
MHENASLVTARIDRFIRERLVPALYREQQPMRVTAWEVPDEPVPFDEAVAQSFADFRIGDRWGKPWGTTWFRAEGVVPDWDATDAVIEAVVDLGFLRGQAPGGQAEGLVFDARGSILKAVEPLNTHVPLTAGPGERVELIVEAAANPASWGAPEFSPIAWGDKATAGSEPFYTLNRLHLALLDRPVWEFERDIHVLRGLMLQLPDDARRGEILRALERAIDVIDPVDVSGTAADGRDQLREALAKPANASAHRTIAVGHAHIDSAWLWPVRETIRKCARTFSNALQLMDEHPDFVFACSSAQQFDWMKRYYPDLFARILERVREWRFVPVGGMWVEADTNMPGGEAMARQFVVGKRYFREELGVDPVEVWLPDSFGYSAGLPQLVAAAGFRYFLSQKISWNETNAFPHHTFRWEGIDGTRVFAHFPPSDTYSSDLSAEQLARGARQYAEKGHSNVSLLPFGYGDGGGGPTREMMATAKRTASLEGSPTVEIATPREFFELAEADYPDAPVWSGELYLEFHRGTYTSQARTKRGNRRSEHLLREAELWAVAAFVRAGLAYPVAELREAWETVLLQQFHDILPGSSIAWVHRVAKENYAKVEESLEAIIRRSLEALVGDGDRELAANASPFAVGGVPALGVATATVSPAASVTPTDRGFLLRNDAVAVEVDERGLIVSLVDLQADRELIAGEPANLLQLFRDVPTRFDAWDIDLHYRRSLVPLTAATAVEATDDGVRVEREFGSSRVSQHLSLAGDRVEIVTTVDWHERQKLLKLAFPLDLHAANASSETQFGHVVRPTHSNTSWDFARFETVAHRWVHVGEPGYGVAVANDSTYGHDVTRTTRDDGGTTTLVRQSLLRAPLFPDPESDQGEHVLRTSIRVGTDVLGAAEEGYRLNLPVRGIRGGSPVEPLLRVSNPAIVVEAVKLAEDGSGDVVVRLYEARGAKARGRLTWGFATARVWETDLLEEEREGRPAIATDAGETTLALRPFEIVTLRAARAG